MLIFLLFFLIYEPMHMPSCFNSFIMLNVFIYFIKIGNGVDQAIL